MATMREFVRANAITMAVDCADSNPNNDDFNGDHWRCTIRRKDNGRRRSMTVYFSQGYGHNGKEPRVCDVLDCLASDASGIENARDFADWAGEYGYDEDSRKAERTYRTTERQSLRLRRFLGDALYNALLWDTERD